MSYDLAMRNPEPPGEIRSRGKLGPWDSQHLDTIPLSGAYTFDKADLGVYGGIAGTLSAKGEFQGVLGKIETQGTTEIPNFEVTRAHHPVNLKTKFTATVDGTGGDTILQSVDGTFLHTAVACGWQPLHRKPGKPGKTTTLNMTVRDGHVEDVLAALRQGEPNRPCRASQIFMPTSVWPSGKPAFSETGAAGRIRYCSRAMGKCPTPDQLNELSKRASGKKKDASHTGTSPRISRAFR